MTLFDGQRAGYKWCPLATGWKGWRPGGQKERLFGSGRNLRGCRCPRASLGTTPSHPISVSLSWGWGNTRSRSSGHYVAPLDSYAEHLCAPRLLEFAGVFHPIEYYSYFLGPLLLNWVSVPPPHSTHVPMPKSPEHLARHSFIPRAVTVVNYFSILWLVGLKIKSLFRHPEQLSFLKVLMDYSPCS